MTATISMLITSVGNNVASQSVLVRLVTTFVMEPVGAWAKLF